MPVSCSLHEQINFVVVVEKVIKLYEVGVLKKSLNFDFVDELFDHLLSMFRRDIQDRCFLDNLERSNETSLLVTTLLQNYIARKT